MGWMIKILHKKYGISETQARRIAVALQTTMIRKLNKARREVREEDSILAAYIAGKVDGVDLAKEILREEK